MNKQKTRKSVARRFRITKKGKVLHRLSGRRHRASHKSTTQKTKKKMVEIKGTEAKKIKKISQ